MKQSIWKRALASLLAMALLVGAAPAAAAAPASENLALHKNATTGNPLNGFTAAMAVDGDPGTAWATNGGKHIKVGQSLGPDCDVPAQVTVDFEAPTEFDRVVVKEYRSSPALATDYRMKDLYLLTSQDGRQWTIRQHTLALEDGVTRFVLEQPVICRYVRVYVATVRINWCPMISELEVYCDHPGTGHAEPERANLALGASPISDKDLQGFPREKLNDGDPLSAWASPDMPCYAGVDLGAAVRFNRIVVNERIAADQRLGDMVIQTSQNGTEWTDCSSLRASASGVTEILLEEPAFARYLRVYVASANGTNPPMIGEIEIYNDDRVLPPIQEMERAIIQRRADNKADVVIRNYTGGEGLEARLVKDQQTLKDWTPVAEGGCVFSNVPAGGWYSIEMRLAGKADTAETVVGRIGVGDVYITSGQSNSVCFGTDKTKAVNDTVVTYHPIDKKWYPCEDVQPAYSGNLGSGGSAWPTAGDLLTEAEQIPVGFVVTGFGGAAVSEFLGAKNHYQYLKAAIDGLKETGFRAILWHQGETDAIRYPGNPWQNYEQDLNALINMTRRDAGFDVPWIVAHVSYHPKSIPEQVALVRNAQSAVCADPDDRTYMGPDTDILGPQFRSPKDHVHFNRQGILRHGAMWAAAIQEVLDQTPGDKTALQAAAEEAGRLQQRNYTPESWAAFAQPLAEARALLNREAPGPLALLTGLYRLTDARNALVPVPMDTHIAENVDRQVKYRSAAEAIADAVRGDTIVMLQDSTEDLLLLDKGITLDLQGRKLTARGLVAFNDSRILDSSRGQGLLRITNPGQLVLPKKNGQMALWNGAGYVFGAVTMQQSQLQTVQDEKGTGFQMVFRPVFISDAVSRQYFADGAADNRLTAGVRVSYTSGQNDSVHAFSFADYPYVEQVYAEGSAFALTLRGFTDSYQNIRVETYLISESGVEICGTAQTFRIPAAG